MKYTYKSHFAEFIRGLIAQKRMIGFPYDSPAWILKHFDIHCLNLFPNEEKLTQNIVMTWADKRENEHPNGLIKRVTPVRQLAKYMNNIGVDAYILPNGIPRKQVKYKPHIYTKEELSAFFRAADHPPKCNKHNSNRNFILPIIFRVIYCCGLRKGEAIKLKISDVNMETGTLFIQESKGFKDRLLYMSDDLTALCKKYDNEISTILPNRVAFFPNMTGSFISSCVVGVWFHLIWDNLEMSQNSELPSARIHDFRHTYAVNTLNKWVMEDRDITSCVQYLSQYMGHTLLESTDYYLHLTKEFFPVVREKLLAVTDYVIPEGDYE